MDTGMSLTMAPTDNPRFSGISGKTIDSEIKNGRQKVVTGNPIDRKKLRRLVSNRLSARRSREKKTQYILHLEKSLEDLKVFISTMAPKVRGYKDKVNFLMIENHSMLKQVQEVSHQSRLKEMECEQLKVQVMKLKGLENGLKHHMYEQSLGGQQKHYPTLSFYQERMENFIKHGIHQRVESTLYSQHTGNYNKDELSTSRIKHPHEISEQEEMQEENDIDQYLNIDAATADFPNIPNLSF